MERHECFYGSLIVDNAKAETANNNFDWPLLLSDKERVCRSPVSPVKICDKISFSIR